MTLLFYGSFNGFFRKLVLEKNKTTSVYQDSDSIEEEVDLVLWLWNAFMSWAFEEPPLEGDIESETVSQAAETVDIVEDVENLSDESQGGSWFWNVIFKEEEHLEYFYLFSTAFLLYLVIIIIKRQNQVIVKLRFFVFTFFVTQVSQRKAQLLHTLQKMKLEPGLAGPGAPGAVMRQISFH